MFIGYARFRKLRHSADYQCSFARFTWPIVSVMKLTPHWSGITRDFTKGRTRPLFAAGSWSWNLESIHQILWRHSTDDYSTVLGISPPSHRGAPWNAKCAYRPKNRRGARGDLAKVLVDSLKATLGSGVQHIEQSTTATFLLHPL